jgi:hypothetical protein
MPAVEDACCLLGVASNIPMHGLSGPQKVIRLPAADACSSHATDENCKHRC